MNRLVWTIVIGTILSGCVGGSPQAISSNQPAPSSVAHYYLLTSESGVEVAMTGPRADGTAFGILFTPDDDWSFEVASAEDLSVGMSQSFGTDATKALLIVFIGSSDSYEIEVIPAQGVSIKNVGAFPASVSSWMAVSAAAETDTYVTAWNITRVGSINPEEVIWNGDLVLSAIHETKMPSLSLLFWSASETTSAATVEVSLETFGHHIEQGGHVSPATNTLGHAIRTGEGTVDARLAFEGTSTSPYLEMYLLTAPLPDESWQFAETD